MNTSKSVFFGLLALLGLAALCVAAYLGSWWIFADSTAREAEIRKTSVNYQQTAIDRATSMVTEIRTIDVQITNATPAQVDALRAQRVAIVNEACDLIGQVNDTIPPALSEFNRKECL